MTLLEMSASTRDSSFFKCAPRMLTMKVRLLIYGQKIDIQPNQDPSHSGKPKISINMDGSASTRLKEDTTDSPSRSCDAIANASARFLR